MGTTEILWTVYEWLPRAFVLDLFVFHLVADHPLAIRWWAWRPRHPRRRLGWTGSL